MEKLRATDIIDIDDQFITAVAEKVAEINKSSISKIYSLREISEIVKVSNKALLEHVRNYKTNNNKYPKLIASKIGRDWRVTEENLKIYLNQ